MDAANILVGVLTTTAVGWLIWAEMNSRRNSARQNANELTEETELKPQRRPRK
jgi:hypothetical protein